jgi:L-serine dehydratase
LKLCPDVKSVKVSLYDSLALTGKGHLTDAAIIEELGTRKVDMIWKPNEKLKHHNGMRFGLDNLFVISLLSEALDGKKKGFVYEVYSVGGGALLDASTKKTEEHQIYPYSNFTMIEMWSIETGKYYIFFFEFLFSIGAW